MKHPDAAADALGLPLHRRGRLPAAEFQRRLAAEVEAERARIRAAPSPLAGLTRADLRRSRACPLPEIIGVAPEHMRRGDG